MNENELMQRHSFVDSHVSQSAGTTLKPPYQDLDYRSFYRNLSSSLGLLTGWLYDKHQDTVQSRALSFSLT